MIADRVVEAVRALRSAGHRVEEVPGVSFVYRVDRGEALTGPDVVALAIKLGLIGGSQPSIGPVE